MKLVETSNPVKKHNTGQSVEFKIKTSAKAAKILSDGLYKDKIAAVIRELSTNARDSHVEAGKADVPFKVIIPTQLYPYFHIRDYGVGLSPKDVKEIYTTYFESTKTHTNDLVGCLGLGSKSPLAYTDNFGLSSYWNGKKYTYIIYWSEQGLPCLDEVSCLDTDEQNGIEIKIAVKNQDIREFTTKAQKIYKWFDVKPNINIDIPSEEFIKKEKDYGLLKTNTYGYNQEQPYVIMGEIAYPIYVEQICSKLPENDTKEIIEAVLANSFVYFFNLGELDIQASREELSYDKRTIRNLINKITECTKDFIKDYVERFDDIKTLWDAKLKISEIKNEVNPKTYKIIEPLILKEKKHLFPYGKAFLNFNILKYINDITIYQPQKQHNKGIIVSKTSYGHWDININIPYYNYFFIFIESQKAYEKSIKEWARDLYSSDTNKNLIFVRIKYKLEHSYEILKEIERLGIPEDKIFFAEELFQKVKLQTTNKAGLPKTRKKRVKIENQEFDLFEFKFDRMNPRMVDANIAYWRQIKENQIRKENVYYVDLYKNSTQYPSDLIWQSIEINSSINFEIARKHTELKKLLGEFQLIGIPSGSSSFKKKRPMPNFFNELKRIHQSYCGVVFDVFHNFNYEFESFLERSKGLLPKNHLLLQLLSLKEENENQSSIRESLNYCRTLIREPINWRLSETNKVSWLYDFITKEKYPLLLRAIKSNYNYNRDEYAEALEYVKLIDQFEKDQYK